MEKSFDTYLPILSQTYLQPNRLQYFLAVYETQNMHRAATRCGVSQQAVSKALAKLEDTLQVQLFERLPNGVKPTIYADRLAKRAKLILTESRLASLEIEALRGAKSGVVRVGVGPSIGTRLMPLAIERMRKRSKNSEFMTFVGHTQKVAPMVLSGEIEFAIVAPIKSLILSSELKIEQLYDEIDLVIGRSDHPLSHKKNRELGDYLDYPWVAPVGIQTLWTSIVDVFSAEGIDSPKTIFRTDSMAGTLGHILESSALCLLCRELVFRHLEANQLSIISHPKLMRTRGVIVLTRKRGQLSPGAELLKRVAIETLMSEASEATKQPFGC